MKDKENYPCHTLRVREDLTLSRDYVVKNGCMLHEYLKHFHIMKVFLLMFPLEGTVPFEIALCFSYFISQIQMTLEYFNSQIQNFQYKHYDRIKRPQIIGRKQKGSIGGNRNQSETGPCFGSSHYLWKAMYQSRTQYLL